MQHIKYFPLFISHTCFSLFFPKNEFRCCHLTKWNKNKIDDIAAWQQVDEKHIKTIHLHSANTGGNSNASGNIAPGKSAHRPKTHLQNNLSHDKYETIGTSIHSHGRPGTPSMPSSDRNRGEFSTNNYLFSIYLQSIQVFVTLMLVAANTYISTSPSRYTVTKLFRCNIEIIIHSSP